MLFTSFIDLHAAHSFTFFHFCLNLFTSCFLRLHPSSLAALCHWQDLPRSPVAPPLDSCFLRPARPANRRPPSRWASRSPSSSPKWSQGTKRRFTFPPPGHLEGEEPAWGPPLPPLSLLHFSLKDPIPQKPLKSRDSHMREPEGGVGIHPVAPADHRGTRTFFEEPGMYCNNIQKRFENYISVRGACTLEFLITPHMCV